MDCRLQIEIKGIYKNEKETLNQKVSFFLGNCCFLQPADAPVRLRQLYYHAISKVFSEGARSTRGRFTFEVFMAITHNIRC